MLSACDFKLEVIFVIENIFNAEYIKVVASLSFGRLLSLELFSV